MFGWSKESHVRYLILSLVLVSRVEAQTRTWVLVGTTADTTYYLDSAIVATPDDDIIDVWTKLEFTRTILQHKANSYSHLVSRYRINCKTGRWRNNQTVYYRGTTLVRRSSSSARPILYRPLWPTERELLQLACGMAVERKPPAL